MTVAALVVPIVVSAVLVFLVSSIVHMMIPWHRNDYPAMPNEDRALEALRPLAIPPGDYMAPRAANMQDMRSPSFVDKMQKGPVMVLTVLPNGQTGMGRSLALWFVYLLVVSGLSGLLASSILPRGAHSHDVVHLTLVASFMGYCLALWQMTIWYRRAWMTTLKATIDGLIYAAVTAATFAYFWPR